VAAFWMLGTNIGSVGWPSCGEVDIMEWVDNYGPGVTSSALHGPGYSAAETSECSQDFERTRVDDANYHIYGVIWSPNQIQFYRDTTTNITRTITSADIPPGTTWAYNHPFFILLNQAVGELVPRPGRVDAGGQRRAVDYVRVYQAARHGAGHRQHPRRGQQHVRVGENAGASALVANRASASTWNSST